MSDVQQGALGDCYLLGALSVVACRPDLLDQIFGHFKLVDSSVTHGALMQKGIFTVQMYKDCTWHDVTVDTRIPCCSHARARDASAADAVAERHHSAATAASTPSAAVAESAPLVPAFGRCTEAHQMWVPILEKAYAKLHGSYGAIAKGNLAESLADLTGGVSETVDLKSQRALEAIRDGALWRTIQVMR